MAQGRFFWLQRITLLTRTKLLGKGLSFLLYRQWGKTVDYTLISLFRYIGWRAAIASDAFFVIASQSPLAMRSLGAIQEPPTAAIMSWAR
jgi:hypothetical protein